jgi:hypothetical protein
MDFFEGGMETILHKYMLPNIAHIFGSEAVSCWQHKNK